MTAPLLSAEQRRRIETCIRVKPDVPMDMRSADLAAALAEIDRLNALADQQAAALADAQQVLALVARDEYDEAARQAMAAIEREACAALAERKTFGSARRAAGKAIAAEIRARGLCLVLFDYQQFQRLRDVEAAALEWARHVNPPPFGRALDDLDVSLLKALGKSPQPSVAAG